MTMKVAVSLILLLVVLLTVLGLGQPILNNTTQAIADNIPGVESRPATVQDQAAYTQYADSIREFGDFISRLRSVETGSMQKSNMCFDYVQLPSEEFFHDFSIQLAPSEDGETYYVKLLQTQSQLGDQESENLVAAREEFHGLCVLDDVNTRRLLDEIWGRTQGTSSQAEFVNPLVLSEDNTFGLGLGSPAASNFSESAQRIYAAYKQGGFGNIGLSEDDQDVAVSEEDVEAFDQLLDQTYTLTDSRVEDGRGSLPEKIYKQTQKGTNIIMKDSSLSIMGVDGELCLFTENLNSRRGQGTPAIAKQEDGTFIGDTAYFFQTQGIISQIDDVELSQPTLPTVLYSLGRYACTPQGGQ